MIPHEPIFANIRDRHNLGDMLCGARAIFPELPNARVLDFREVTDGPEPLIVGGGGLLHPGVDSWIGRQARIRSVVLLGVGINYHDERSARGWEERKGSCIHVGLRDKTFAMAHPRYEYCPCPTAGMLNWPEYERKAPHSEELLLFQHFDRPILAPGTVKMPRRTNLWDPAVTLASVATDLGRYRRVLTNSYHGALWSLRVGCHVALWKPFSSRFSTGFPVKLPVCDQISDLNRAFSAWDNADYRERVRVALNSDYDYLEEFRQTVLEFLTPAYHE